jgi:methanogen homocitrate synthase
MAVAGFKDGKWAVSPYNFDEAVRKDMHLPKKVQLMDMTLREGRQVSGVYVGHDEVLEFARRIDDIGIHIVEMHHDLLDEIRDVKKMKPNFRIQGLIHPTAALNPKVCAEEIDILADAGTDIICPAFAISDYNYQLVESMGGLKMSREEALDHACEAVQFGKAKGAFINPNLMDITRLDLKWLLTIVARLKEAGIDMLRVDDICAPCTPTVIKHHVWEVKQVLGDVPLAIHTHDDFNLGMAGQLAALEGGAEVLEGCINGLGERAGVPNLAVLASILEILYGYDTGIDLSKFQSLSEWVADVWNQPIPVHLAGVGKTAFSHAAEVHYVLPKGDQWSFNAWAPAVLGAEAYIPLCNYAGPATIKRKVADDLGWGEISDEVANRILKRVRAEIRMRRCEPSLKDFAKMAQAEGVKAK